MTIQLTKWGKGLLQTYREANNLRTPLGKALQTTYNGLWHSATTRWPIGTNVFERDWDLLVILDACRVDALREVAPEYEFVQRVGSIYSVGSATHEWTCKTFTREHLDDVQRTAYISSKTFAEIAMEEHVYPPYSDTLPFGWPRWNVVDVTDLGHLEKAWETGYDEQFGTIPPRHMTNRAIKFGRTHDFDRYIVHFNQPHIPYIANAVRRGSEPTPVERNPWPSFLAGDLSRDELWEMYLDNLRHVLDSVDTLLDNFDAETAVLTADHGEAMGEWGAYAHPEGFPHSAVKSVPWAETTATDRGTYDPSEESLEGGAVEDREQYLRDLGYL